MPQQTELTANTAGLGTWSISLATGTVELDSGAVNLYRLSETTANQPLALSTFAAALHAEDRNRFHKGIAEAAAPAQTQLFIFEHRVLHGGSTRDLLMRGRITREAAGRGIEIIGLSIDVTPQRAAERALAETRQRLDAALVAGEIGTWLYDVQSDSVKADANLLHLFGISLAAEEIEQGVSLSLFADKVHPDDHAAAIEKIGQCLNEGSTYEVEYRIITDGGERSVIARGSVERNEKGYPQRLSGVILDITDRQRAETARQNLDRQLNEQARTYDALLNSMSDPAYIIAPDGRFQFANRPLLELWGLSASEARGKSLAELQYEPNLIEQLMADIQKVIETGSVVRGESKYTSPTGATGIFEHVFAPVFDQGGMVTAIAGSSRDITDRQQLQEHLKKLASDLSDANRRKDEFLATLAHELRNPLAPLRNGLEVMRRSANDPAALDESRGLMDRQLSQMVHLIDDLLDVNRISRGKIPLRKSRTALADAVQQAVETSRPIIEQAGHQLTITLPPQAIYVHADPTRLAQVFSNLLNNAAKYSERPGSIWLNVERRDHQAIVRVRDDGLGIPPDMLPKIFEMFAQVHPTLERSQGGLGIGLSLAKGLVEMHGGTIEAFSEGVGQGSEFIVRLPIVASPLQSRSTGPSADHPPIARRKILVVDDNRDSATSMARLLNIMGNETHIAHDGIQALAAAETFAPQVILLDIGMPNLNGYDAARRLREKPSGKQIVLIAMTGWGQEEDKRRSKEAGFDHHLVKPVDLNLLEGLLAKL